MCWHIFAERKKKINNPKDLGGMLKVFGAWID
jgi:hypothetical protein